MSLATARGYDLDSSSRSCPTPRALGEALVQHLEGLVWSCGELDDLAGAGYALLQRLLRERACFCSRSGGADAVQSRTREVASSIAVRRIRLPLGELLEALHGELIRLVNASMFLRCDVLRLYVEVATEAGEQLADSVSKNLPLTMACIPSWRLNQIAALQHGEIWLPDPIPSSFLAEIFAVQQRPLPHCQIG